jgi:hypothetical protein
MDFQEIENSSIIMSQDHLQLGNQIDWTQTFLGTFDRPDGRSGDESQTLT